MNSCSITVRRSPSYPIVEFWYIAYIGMRSGCYVVADYWLFIGHAINNAEVVAVRQERRQCHITCVRSTVLVRRPGLLVSAVNAMRCDAMLSTSRLQQCADGPPVVYDVRAPSVVPRHYKGGARARLGSLGPRKPACAEQRPSSKWLLQPHDMRTRANERGRSPGSAQAVLEDGLHRVTLDNMHVV